VNNSESASGSRRIRIVIASAIGLFAVGSFATTQLDGGELGLKAAFTGRAFVEFDGVSQSGCEAIPDAGGACMTVGAATADGVRRIAAITDRERAVTLLVRDEQRDGADDVTVGRRVAFFADPAAGTLTARGEEVFKSVAEWAAGPKRGGDWSALLVLADGSTEEQIEVQSTDVGDVLGSRWELSATAGEVDPSKGWDLLLVAAPVRLAEPNAAGSADRIPAIVWSPELWKQFGFTPSAWLTTAQRLTILEPSHPTVLGIFGGQPTAEKSIESAVWACVLVSLGVVIVALAGRYALGAAMAAMVDGHNVESLPAVVRDGWADKVQRHKRWNDTFQWVCLGIAALALIAGLFGIWVLRIAEESGRDPEMPEAVRALWSSAAWMSLSLTIVLGARLIAAWRQLGVYQRVEAAAEVAGTNDEDDRPDGSAPVEGIGVALSGGGIRAAAFGIGALETLQERDDFDRVAYLSAVSGGAYAAASYSALRRVDGEVHKPYELDSEEMRRLRNNTNYLAPSLVWKIRAFGEWLIGLLANLVLVAAAIWLLAAVVSWIVSSPISLPQLSALPDLEENAVPFVSWPWTVPSAFMALAVLAGLAALAALLSMSGLLNAAARPIARRFAEALVYATLVIVLLVGVIPRAVQFGEALSDLAMNAPGRLQALFGAAGVAVIAATLRGLLARHGGRIAQWIAGLAVPIAAFAFFVWAGWTNVGWDLAKSLIGVAVAIVLLGLAAIWPTRMLSLNPFYRRRLAVAFAPKDPLLHDLDPETRPELMINAVANIGPGPVSPPGRSSLPYVFTTAESGLLSDGAQNRKTTPTSELNEFVTRRPLDKNPKGWLPRRNEDPSTGLTLMQAVAISGAAVSPSMGRQTVAAFRSLLALLNVRLGVWLPNPLFSEVWQQERFRKDFGVAPHHLPRLFMEMFGSNRPTDTQLYITDGGHYDNLGLVTLLRERCRSIWVFDASGEDPDGFSTIGQAVMLAKAELGIDIDFEPDLLLPLAQGEDDPPVALRNHVRATIRYGPGPDEVGVLTYCRAIVTRETPWPIVNYRNGHPSFPNTTTANQLFDDEAFEAYRSLGSYVAQSATEGITTL
jgi:hypothetical protein